MTSPGYGVAPDDVRAHGTQLTNVVFDRVDMVADAAGQVGIGDDEAYGKILQFVIPPILKATVGDASESLKKLAELGESITGSLQQIAASYEDTDDELSKIIEGIITR